MLSLHSEVSTSSSEARRNAAAQAEEVETYRSIGAGNCGVVFAQDGKSTVTKLARYDGEALWNDYLMHWKIAKAFKRFNLHEIKTPACYFFVPRKETKYFDKHPNLVQAAETTDRLNLPTAGLVTERILPLPKPPAPP
jgi:hypothetical protein